MLSFCPQTKDIQASFMKCLYFFSFFNGRFGDLLSQLRTLRIPVRASREEDTQSEDTISTATSAPRIVVVHF
jgi:hypothetical protein